MGIFDTPSRLVNRDYGDIYRQKADRLREEGRHLLRLGRLEEAEEKIRQLISVQAKVVGERHPDYASGLTMLAEVLLARDELSDAETLLQRALEIRRKSLGDQHPDYAASLDLLARLMMRWEDYQGAEPLLRKALEIRRSVLGVDHPDYASSLALLAEVVGKSEDFDTAEPLFREAIETVTRVRGEDHPEVADTCANLAQLLIRQGETTEAESLLRNAIEIYRQAYGERHNSYVTSTTNLALLLQNRGDHQAAEPLWRLLLDMRKQSLGDKHPECALILMQLAQILQRQGDITGAESLFREAAAIRKQALGERHPEYATSLTYLASAMQRLGDLQGAEPLLRQALAIRKDVLGVRNPEYGTSLMNLALLVQKRGDITWAKMLLKEAVEVRRAVYGESHPEYAHALVSLGDIIGQQGEPAKAEAMIRRALEIRGESLGEFHPAYAANLCSLAAVMKKQGDFQEAEALLRRSLQIRKEVIGEEHPDFITNLGNLAWLLQRRGDLRGAERLLAHSLELRRRLVGVAHPDFQQNLERLKKLQADAAPKQAPQAEITAAPQPNEVTQAQIEDVHAEAVDDEALEDHDDSIEEAMNQLSDAETELPFDPIDEEHELYPDEAREVHEEALGLMGPEDDLDGPTHHDLDAHDDTNGMILEPVDDSIAYNDIEEHDERSAVPKDSCQEISVKLFGFGGVVPNALSLGFMKTPEQSAVASVGSWSGTVSEDVATSAFARLNFTPSNDQQPETPAHSDVLEIDSEIADNRQWTADDHKAFHDVDLLTNTETFIEDMETVSQELLNDPSIPRNGIHDLIEYPDAGDDLRESTELALHETTQGDEPAVDASEPCFSQEAIDDTEVTMDLEPSEAEDSGGVPPDAVQDEGLDVSVDPFEHVTSAEGSSRPSLLGNDSMNMSSSDLSQELSELSDRFSNLGEKLLAAARQLHAPGTPPSDELIETIRGCRHDFVAFRDKTRGLADEMGVAAPQAESINSLQAASTLLDAIAEVELHKSKNEEVRRRGISVLDRVLAIQHAGAGEFEPLRACQSLARDLRQTLEDSHWKGLPSEVEQLTEGEHHFSHLLSLIEDHEDLGDDLWASHHESVSQNFGKALAAAAARSKLTIPQNSGMALAGH